MHLEQLHLLLLHRLESSQYTHHAELLDVAGPEVVRKVSHLLQELLVDLEFLDVGADVFEGSLLGLQTLLFLFDLVSPLHVAQFKLFPLFVVRLSLAVVSKYLLFLLLEFLSRLQLFVVEFLLLKSKFGQSLLHVLLLVQVLRLDLPLLLLDLQQLRVLRLRLKPH
jgi:hypothetical protein